MDGEEPNDDQYASTGAASRSGADVQARGTSGGRRVAVEPTFKVGET